VLAISLALAASLGFAGSAILARAGMQGIKPLPSTLISLAVSSVPAVILALVFASSDIRALPLVALLWLLGLGAMNFLGGRTLNYLAIGRVGASRSSAILGTTAVFSAIFAISITGERPHFLVLLGTAGVVIGLVIATGESLRRGWSGDRRSLVGYLLALAAAVSYGGATVMAKELTLAYGSPLMVSGFGLLFGLALLSPLAGRQTVHDLRASRPNPGFVVYAGLSGLASAAAVISLYYAVQRGDVVVVAPVVAINPLMTLLLAHLFIARLENITRQLVVGTALTVIGVLIVVAGSTV
jgi:drug/metabolite transporter (DMT)-like permease